MAEIRGGDSLQRFRDLAASFRRREFAPLYLFCGEEDDYYMDQLQQLASRYAVEEDMRDFNYDQLYGDEINAADAIAVCLTMPMMTKRRLIVIRRFELMADKRRWAAYAKRPNPKAVVLLLCQRRPDFRAMPFKVLRASGMVTEFAPLKGRRIGAFIRQQVKVTHGTIDAEAVACLEEYVGTSRRAIVGEIRKLQTFVGTRTHLTADDVVQAIGQSREVNLWELQDAVREGRLAAAERITSKLLARSGNRSGEAIRVVAMLGRFFINAWWAHGLRRRGFHPNQIGKTMQARAFLVHKYIDTARRFGLHGLHQALGTLLAADCELKGESPRDARLILTLMMRRMHRAAAPRRH